MKVLNHPKVDKFIRDLPASDQARITHVIELFEENGFNLTDNHLKKLTKGLWELRAGRWRLLFGVMGNNAVVVSMFLKSTQKTPKKEIELALKRFEEII
jgi:phage-related protein